MTSQVSNLGFNTSSVDLTALTWVLSEVQRALADSDAAFSTFVVETQTIKTDPSRIDFSSLRQSRQHYHQAIGALQIVGLQGIEAYQKALDSAWAAIENDRQIDDLTVKQVGKSLQSLSEYIEDLAQGEPENPLRLFVPYQALLKISHIEQALPSDLWRLELPGLHLAEVKDVTQTTERTPIDVIESIRDRYEVAVLTWLRSTAEQSELTQTSLLTLAECMNTTSQVGEEQAVLEENYWHLAEQFFLAISCGAIAAKSQTKRLAARINLLLKEYAHHHLQVPEKLVVDTLFELAFAEDKNIYDDEMLQNIRKIRTHYSFPKETLLTQIDLSNEYYAIIPSSILSQAKQCIQSIRIEWDSFSAGDVNAATPLLQQLDQFEQVAQAYSQESLLDLTHAMQAQVKHISKNPKSASAELGIEFAATILFIEQSLRQSWNCAGKQPQALLFGQRCQELTVYLEQIGAGKTVAKLPWLDELSRDIEATTAHRKIVAELRSNLQEVESYIETYNQDPTQHEDLQSAVYLLDQNIAILDALGLPQALQATSAAQEQLLGLIAAPIENRASFVHYLAEEISHLHFYFDALPLKLSKDDFEKKQFIPDNSLAHNQSYVASSNNDISAPLLSDVRAQIHLLAPNFSESITTSVDTQDLQNALRNLDEYAVMQDDLTILNQIQKAWNLVPEVQLGDKSAYEALTQLFVTQISAPQQTTSLPIPESDAHIDKELLGIFLEEAREVLAGIRSQLHTLQTNSSHPDTVTQVRRAFHTLKGSGRMVGLVDFGEAAWAVEQILNIFLAESRAITPQLIDLLDYSSATLQSCLNDIDANQAITEQTNAVIEAVEQFKSGTYQGAAHSVQLRKNEGDTTRKVDFNPEITLLESLPSIGKLENQSEDNLPELIESNLSENIDQNESVTALNSLDVDTSESITHDLSLTQIAHQESQLEGNHAQEGNVIEFPFATALAKQEDNFKQIGALRISLPLYNVYLQEADTLITRLATDFSEWRHESRTTSSEIALRSAHSLQGSSATVGLEPVRQIAAKLESTLIHLQHNNVAIESKTIDVLSQCVEVCRSMLHQFAAGLWPKENGAVSGLLEACQSIIQKASAGATPKHKEVKETSSENLKTHSQISSAENQNLSSAYDAAFLSIFIEEAQEILSHLGNDLRHFEQAPHNVSTTQQLLRALHTLKGSARMAGVMSLGQTAHDMESTLELGLRKQEFSKDAISQLYSRYDQLLEQLDRIKAGENIENENNAEIENTQHDVTAVEAQNNIITSNENASTSEVDVTSKLTSIDADKNLVQHTLQVNPEESAAFLAERNRTLVRVQAQTLDGLMNDVSEVGVSRSRLENEIGGLKNYLLELNDNVGRLRGQLRELEIQAETQMQSRLAHAHEVHEQFDPLEFDRFTRFQEVTRMMAESVNDVATVQTNLIRGFEQAEGNLTSQARLTRGLQQHLMQTRMVQFDTISARLYRVARQAADETHKAVRLIIKGAAVELDRSVLERMAGPLEHLIRNAVVHGVETKAGRIAKGKPELGELSLEVQQEGNEVLLHFYDDGQGLDFGRIRARAIEHQLLNTDEEINSERLSEIIFSPGFSTAEQVTEIAGRGVGMDVVRAETVALGGRIELQSQADLGTRFTIHLPLTTAITQALLVKAGGRLYAIPSSMVEQVTQLPVTGLTEAYNQSIVKLAGQSIPFYYFGALLDVSNAIPAGQRYAPVVIVRSGNERVAVHVDETVGNREVVVKHIGAQLARLEGIAGATILGNGDIALIYNPLVLAHRYERLKTVQQHPQIIGAVAELTQAKHTVNSDVESLLDGAKTSETSNVVTRPVEGLAVQATVMVVDDSLTVRKISQRLLSRAGYQVLLAKDGVDALKQLQTVTPNIMLVDIEMPHMDGFDLTRNIRADNRTKHIPIIMITSRTAEKHRKYAQDIGVDEYLGKPFNDEELLKLIEKFIISEV